MVTPTVLYIFGIYCEVLFTNQLGVKYDCSNFTGERGDGNVADIRSAERGARGNELSHGISIPDNLVSGADGDHGAVWQGYIRGSADFNLQPIP